MRARPDRGAPYGWATPEPFTLSEGACFLPSAMRTLLSLWGGGEQITTTDTLQLDHTDYMLLHHALTQKCTVCVECVCLVAGSSSAIN